MQKSDISNMELVKEYPWLQIKDSDVAWLDMLPNGWRWLIIDMCVKIAELLDKYDIDRSEYKVTDAKEKWGSLSWFSWLGDLDSIDNEIEGIDDATFRYVQALITNIEREYEHTSGNICMVCGRYKPRNMIVCNECAERTRREGMTKYYIAYGSNLNIAQMAKRCPDAKIYETGELKDYELLFRGQPFQAYLTIEPKDGSSVPIAIWEVSHKDEQNLDFYEGYPLLYDKHTVKLDNGIEAFVYIMKDEAGREISVPSKPYLDTCERGYKDFNFDIDVLEKAYLKYFFG